MACNALMNVYVTQLKLVQFNSTKIIQSNKCVFSLSLLFNIFLNTFFRFFISFSWFSDLNLCHSRIGKARALYGPQTSFGFDTTCYGFTKCYQKPIQEVRLFLIVTYLDLTQFPTNIGFWTFYMARGITWELMQVSCQVSLVPLITVDFPSYEKRK